MLSLVAVVLNRLINCQAGLRGRVQAQLDSEVAPRGAQENRGALQGESLQIFSRSKGNLCWDMTKIESEWWRRWRGRINQKIDGRDGCKVKNITVGKRWAWWREEDTLERWKAGQSFRRRERGKGLIELSKSQEGWERAQVFYRMWKLGHLAECAAAAVFPRRWSSRELIRANVDTGWVTRVDQCSETIASAFHLAPRPQATRRRRSVQQTRRFATWLRACPLRLRAASPILHTNASHSAAFSLFFHSHCAKQASPNSIRLRASFLFFSSSSSQLRWMRFGEWVIEKWGRFLNETHLPRR